MENPFKVGDVVVLKSGSPKMVVYEINEDRIECCYFDKTKNTIASTISEGETGSYPNKPYSVFELYDPLEPNHNTY